MDEKPFSWFSCPSSFYSCLFVYFSLFLSLYLSVFGFIHMNYRSKSIANLLEEFYLTSFSKDRIDPDLKSLSTNPDYSRD